MRKIVLGVVVAVIAAVGGGIAAFMLWPAKSDRPPVLAESPPLQPATRTSIVIVPAAISLNAIREALENRAPRDLSGARDNPLGRLLSNGQIGWAFARGPFAVAGRPEGLTIAAQMNGAMRVTGQVGGDAGNAAGALGNIIGGNVGQQMQNLSGRAIDQRAEVKGLVGLSARPAFQPNWRIEPNLAGQVEIGEANVTVAGAPLELSRQVKPLLDRAVSEQLGQLQNRVRNDPFVETAARQQWSRMCRSIPVGKATPGMPDLWLEVRPVRAVAAQPTIDANALTLTIGVQAETRIVPAETKPDCPFPATLEIVQPMPQGRIALGVPIDMPFTEVNRLLETQLKGRTFPEDGSGSTEATVQRVTVAASGTRLLISLRVKAREKKSWFGLGAEATVHIWGKPQLDQAQQILRFTDVAVDVESEAAFGLLGAAARATIPYLKDALAKQANIDLKPFAANARQNIEKAVAEFRTNAPGVQADVNVTDLRLAGIEYDAKTLRIIGEAEGTVKIAISALPGF